MKKVLMSLEDSQIFLPWRNPKICFKFHFFDISIGASIVRTQMLEKDINGVEMKDRVT